MSAFKVVTWAVIMLICFMLFVACVLNFGCTINIDELIIYKQNGESINAGPAQENSDGIGIDPHNSAGQAGDKMENPGISNPSSGGGGTELPWRPAN